MTEQEAISVLKMIETHGSLPTNAKDEAIKALEEVQQYRAIGTPAECRLAVEKQQTMDWDAKHDECVCPKCATLNPTWKMRAKTVKYDKVYCWHCGQSVEFRLE